MIRSMTAFARQENQFEWGTLIWEVRSVNHRYLEPTPRLPDEFRQIESKIRQCIQSKLKRGKIDCTLRFHPAAHNDQAIELNTPLLQQLLHTTNQIQQQHDNIADINPIELLNWPGVLQSKKQDFDNLYPQAISLLDNALDDLVSMRETEGKQLKQLITQRCKAVNEHVVIVEQKMPEIIQKFRDKLSSRLNELMDEVDPQRIEQEISLLAQKLDIAEETDRLNTHTTEVLKILEKDQPVGRKLDFLMQELHREANTLSAKSIDTTITQCAIEIKVLIEQMREQVQNIE
ncbi:MAG: YicC family protein [Methylococcales bacterium]|jgi:uncharacterized protein (TIGR00255 family)|nr:YicC family protein [Methylococcales bacterium]MBT7445648.1 YicC family protein [Methylococcales bacterium]